MIILVNHVLFDFGKVYILVNSILAAIQEKKLSRHSPAKRAVKKKLTPRKANKNDCHESHDECFSNPSLINF